MDTTESTAPWDSPEPIEMMMQRMSDGSPAPASLSQATDGSTLAPWDSSEPIEAMMQRMSGVSVNYPRSLTPKLVSNATCNEPKTSREGKKRMAFLR